MTCDERIEALLNRAGQTISDLPRGNDNGMPYGVDAYKPLLKEASDFTRFTAPAGFEVFNVIQYALHLTDIIDRMEWALENVIGERDYLVKQMPCKYCEHYEVDEREEPCKSCIKTVLFGKYAPKQIVPEWWTLADPEPWREDDD